MARVRLYVDESGDHRPPRAGESIQCQYLGLVGVALECPDVALVDGVARLQRVICDDLDEPPILHREDIVNRRGHFQSLSDAELKRKFDEELLRLLQTLKMYAVCVVVDKAKHSQKTNRETTHPYHFGLRLLLERYVWRLEKRGAVGDVMAEARGKTEDTLLRTEYKDIHSKGTTKQPAEQFQRVLTSRELKLKTKVANVAGLQVADLLAHPLKRDVLRENGIIQEPATGFEAELLKVVDPKYNRRGYDGKVAGYGRILV